MTAEPSYPVSATPYGQRVATYFGFAPAKPVAKVGDVSMINLLRRNNLGALAMIIQDDPSIPSPGELTMIANRAKYKMDLEAERLA